MNAGWIVAVVLYVLGMITVRSLAPVESSWDKIMVRLAAIAWPYISFATAVAFVWNRFVGAPTPGGKQ